MSICVGQYMCRCVCVCVCVSQDTALDIILRNYASFEAVHWPGIHQWINCQAEEPQGPSCLYLPSAAITSTCCCSGILCDLGDSAGSKACKANTLPTDYFPQFTIDSNFFFLSSVLGTEPMTLCMLGNLIAHWTLSQPYMFLLKKDFNYLFHGFWDNTSLKRQSSPSTKNLRCASLISR